MKKKLSKILCCVFALTMIMPLNHKAISAKNKIDSAKVAKKYIVGNITYEYNVENLLKSYSSDTNSNNKESEPQLSESSNEFVCFTIEDKNHEQILDSNSISIITEDRYDNICTRSENGHGINKRIEKIDTGWLIKLDGNTFWNKSKKSTYYKCYISVCTSKYLFTKELQKSDMSKTLKLEINENYIPFKVVVPFSGKNFNIEKIRVNYLSDNTNLFTTFSYMAEVKPNTLIPYGKCNIQLLGTDDNYGYNLQKTFNISKELNTIVFNREDCILGKINFDNSDNPNTDLTNFTISYDLMLKSFENKIFVNGKKYDNFYLGKINSNFSSINALIKQDNWNYKFSINSNYKNADPVVINIGTNFYADINLYKTSYQQGETLTPNTIKLKDQYNNSIYSISNPTECGMPGIIELKNNKNEIKTIPIKNVFNNFITLPHITGTFDMSLKIPYSPLKITSYVKKITITPATVVTFKDPKLEKVIRDKINKPTGDIYKSDVENITELSAIEQGICDLDGIQYLTSLAKLNLYKNNIKDIASLSSMKNLNELFLDVNKISDLSPLKNNLNLKELFVCANPIKDLEVLKTLPQLKSFHFGENNNIDINILKYLPNLTNLRWAYTHKTEDISILKTLPHLRELRLSGNKINDINVLKNLTNLSKVYLDENELTDINPLVDNIKNGGFTNNDSLINISQNNLDISNTSKTYNDIQTLISKGIDVKYTPQKQDSKDGLKIELISPSKDFKGFKIDSDANVTYKVTNTMKQPKTVTLIIAIYDNSNKFINYITVPKTIKAGECTDLSGSIKLLPAACKVKCFVWDNFDNMAPLTTALELPVVK